MHYKSNKHILFSLLETLPNCAVCPARFEIATKLKLNPLLGLTRTDRSYYLTVYILHCSPKWALSRSNFSIRWLMRGEECGEGTFQFTYNSTWVSFPPNRLSTARPINLPIHRAPPGVFCCNIGKRRGRLIWGRWAAGRQGWCAWVTHSYYYEIPTEMLWLPERGWICNCILFAFVFVTWEESF